MLVSLLFAGGTAAVIRAPAASWPARERSAQLAIPLSPAAARAVRAHPRQVVLLDVWATWCDNCLESLQDLAALQRELGPRGFRAVAISVDRGLSTAQVQAWAARRGLGDLAIVHDPSGASQDMLQGQILLRGLPFSILLNRAGEPVDFRFGHTPRTAELSWWAPRSRAALDSLLAGETTDPRGV